VISSRLLPPVIAVPVRLETLLTDRHVASENADRQQRNGTINGEPSRNRRIILGAPGTARIADEHPASHARSKHHRNLVPGRCQFDRRFVHPRPGGRIGFCRGLRRPIFRGQPPAGSVDADRYAGGCRSLDARAHGPLRRIARLGRSLPSGTRVCHAADDRSGRHPASGHAAADERPGPRIGGSAVHSVPGRCVTAVLGPGQVPPAAPGRRDRNPLAAGIAHPGGGNDPHADAGGHDSVYRRLQRHRPADRTGPGTPGLSSGPGHQRIDVRGTLARGPQRGGGAVAGTNSRRDRPRRSGVDTGLCRGPSARSSADFEACPAKRNVGGCAGVRRRHGARRLRRVPQPRAVRVAHSVARNPPRAACVLHGLDPAGPAAGGSCPRA